jgi:hypothetical protein
MQNPREVQAARDAQLRAATAEAQARAVEAEARAAAVQAASRATQGGQGDELRLLRENIRREFAELEERRDQISEQLQNPMVGGANRRGLETRIQQIDARIASLEAQGAEIDAAMARAAGTATTLLPSRPAPVRAPDGGDDPFIVIGALFMLCVALPLSIAYARRLWKRGTDAVAAFPADIAARLARIEQNVDIVALEVERIGESQRFITRAFSEERGLKPGAAEPVVVERDKDVQRRGT